MSEDRPQDTNPAPREGGVSDVPAPTQEAVDKLKPQEQAPLEQKQEQVRGQITGWTIFTFVLTIVLSFIGVFTGHWDDTRGLLTIIIPLEATLIGGIAGYYLGTGRQV